MNTTETTGIDMQAVANPVAKAESGVAPIEPTVTQVHRGTTRRDALVRGAGLAAALTGATALGVGSPGSAEAQSRPPALTPTPANFAEEQAQARARATARAGSPPITDTAPARPTAAPQPTPIVRVIERKVPVKEKEGWGSWLFRWGSTLGALGTVGWLNRDRIKNQLNNLRHRGNAPAHAGAGQPANPNTAPANAPARTRGHVRTRLSGHRGPGGGGTPGGNP